jgi:predicted membrane GTPase involved in stress response
MAQVREDELVEITPQSIRLRKKVLNVKTRLQNKKSLSNEDEEEEE